MSTILLNSNAVQCSILQVACQKSWMDDPVFVAAVTEEYLNERSHFRQTGVKQKRYDRVNKLFPTFYVHHKSYSLFLDPKCLNCVAVSVACLDVPK